MTAIYYRIAYLILCCTIASTIVAACNSDIFNGRGSRPSDGVEENPGYLSETVIIASEGGEATISTTTVAFAPSTMNDDFKVRLRRLESAAADSSVTIGDPASEFIQIDILDLSDNLLPNESLATDYVVEQKINRTIDSATAAMVVVQDPNTATSQTGFRTLTMKQAQLALAAASESDQASANLRSTSAIFWITDGLSGDEVILSGGSTGGATSSGGASAGGTGTGSGSSTGGGGSPASIKLSLGGDNSCALLTNGTVKCWGRDELYVLGNNQSTHIGDKPNQMGANLLPIDFGGATVQSLALSEEGACALTASGIRCWGFNSLGQLGFGNTNTAPRPLDNPVIDLGVATSISKVVAGQNDYCALFADGKAKCWGRNWYGGAGVGDTQVRGNTTSDMGTNLPHLDLGNGFTIKQITGGTHFFCAVLNNNQVKCWGAGTNGQLGLGNTNDVGDQPGEMGTNLPVIDLGTGRSAVQIAAGNNHVCAILDNGKLKCWGSNVFGQLGLGDTANRGDNGSEMGDNLPYVDLGAGTIVQVSSGAFHSCVRFSDGKIKCWGQNNNGKLGYGDTSNRGTSATHMGNNLPYLNLGTGRTVVDMSLGPSHSCAVLNNQTVKCWGELNYGKLGQERSESGDYDYDVGNEPNEMGDNLPVTPL